MAKNDFDIEFDFDKEYGFDPNAGLGSDFDDDAMDISEFDDDGLNLSNIGDENDFSEFDLDSLDLDDDGDLNFDDMDLGEEAEENLEFDEEPDFEEEADTGFSFDDDFDDEDDIDIDIDMPRRKNFFGEPATPREDFDISFEEEAEYPENEEQPVEEAAEAEAPVSEEPVKPRRNPRRKQPVQEENEEKAPIKITVPPILMKLYKLYFPSKEEIYPPEEPSESGSRRRKKRSKMQIFKEFYLPTVIAGISLVLMLSFVIGSLGNFIEKKKIENDQAKKESIALEEQAQQAAQEADILIAEAEILAAGYDYKGAIEKLDSFTGDITQNQKLVAKKAEYLDVQKTLVEHKDPSVIPNLSFHVLMTDITRAKADKDYGGLYNRNFVSTGEFQKILEQLYKNGYVLVDFDSFVASNTGSDGNPSFFTDTIYLPGDKKPVMITETMVNYYAYMTDSNRDGEADAGGAGFASKLVVDANGDIKAELVDTSGQKLVGDYDLVPILENFIKEHPDFSYQGARATLAVSGNEGVFGYRINSATVAKMGTEYYEKEVAGAQELVRALRSKGYTIACYTFEDVAYHNMSAANIQADLQQWNNQIVPVIGQVDTIVFAKTSDIGDYTGGKFQVLYDNGFRFFVKNADEPYGEVNNTYVRQSRMMVTGESMAWKSTLYTNKGLFDPNLVLDIASRGDVPNG